MKNSPTADQLTALLSAGTPQTLTTTRAAAAGYILPLVDAGLPVIPLKPNSRLPALDHSWQRTPVTTESWNTWLDQAFAGGDGDGTAPVLGIGCRAGSLMIVADADTPGEVGALLSFLATHGLSDASPTVRTPGTPDRAHHGGGHWWFLLPPTIAVPAGLPGVLKVDSQGRTGGDTEGETFDLFLYSKQAALPPTVRDPGAYQLVGAVHELPTDMGAWLIDQGKQAREVQDQREARRAERAERRAAGELSESDAAREAWEDASPWSSILTPAGWSETGADPHCGCSQWKHPESSSEKSATAHDCARGTYLEMWSTSCSTLEAGSWSKLYVQAALHHGGNYATAASAAGLPSLQRPSVVMDLRARIAEMRDNPPEQADSMFDPDEYPLGHPNDPQLLHEIFSLSPATRALYHRARSRTVRVAPVAALMGELLLAAETAGPDTGYVVDGRMGPLSTYIVVTGESGSGKSTVMRRSSEFRRGGFQGNMISTGASIDRGSVASGQSIVDTLTEMVPEEIDGEMTGKKICQMIDPAVATISVDEIASLMSNNATAGLINDYLLSGWSGDAFGERSRTHGARRVTGRYVLNLVGGIQPARSEFLVGRDALASGLVQRLFFTNVDDPWHEKIYRGEVAETIEPAEVDVMPPLPQDREVVMPPVALDALLQDQFDAASRRRKAEDAHLLQMRMRMAALITLWHGEVVVSQDYWEWSGLLIEHHRRSRAAVRRAAEIAAQEAADEQGIRSERGRAAGKAAVADDVEETAELLLGLLPPLGTIPRGAWRRKLRANRRPHFDAARDRLLALGVAGTPDGGKTYGRA